MRGQIVASIMLRMSCGPVEKTFPLGLWGNHGIVLNVDLNEGQIIWLTQDVKDMAPNLLNR